MNGKVFGALVAGAILALGGAARAADEGDAKACYRKSCGESIKGHAGMCAGSKVPELKSEKDCTDAGGAWVTADEAAKLKH
ncbi:hypothetical protein KF840_20815 [bacterium]|nr:hypothetical protein [bacterium]